MKKLSKIFKGLLLVLPGVLMFSYEPVMRLFADGAMNYELSLPLLWLVGFDVVVVILMLKRGVLFKKFKWWWMWLLFPAWVLISVAWSLNVTRGLLTAGVLALLYLAVYGMWRLKGLLDAEFCRRFWKWFFGASLVVCVICVVQCVLDLIGVAREWSLICEGCTYAYFGFPHPDGFAIEPQFMGNLLLAPVIVAVWPIITKKYSLNFKFLLFCFFVFVVTLFLTFSRGAIYAMLAGLMVMSVWVLVQNKLAWKRVAMVWGAVILSFGFVLNLQGLMAAVSPTNDTYASGVAKVLNHLSLGVIEVGGNSPVEDSETEVDVVENSVENSEDNSVEKAVFDGYVAESTETRLMLTGAAMEVWKKDLKTVFLGVGIGGAGQALYDNGFTATSKEIVQNQYASLLLETGVVGVALLGLTLGLIWRVAKRARMRVMVVSLMVAYGVSLMFFSGLGNALHIYLLTGLLLVA